MTSMRHPFQPLNKLYWSYERILQASGSNANSCDFLILDRMPDMAALAQATRLVATRHPVLRARIVAGPVRAPYWVADAAPEPQILHQRISGPLPEDAADQLGGNIWARTLDLRGGPPWRLHLSEYDDGTVLQVITSHVFTDGKSANQLIRDLVRAYAAVVAGGHFDASPVEPVTRDMGALYLAALPAARRRQAYASALKGIAHEAIGRPVGLPLRSRALGRTRIALIDLGPARWQALRAAARAEDVSRHPFFVAAMTEAIGSFNAAHGGRVSGHVKLIDNFSLRPFAAHDLTELYELTAVPYALEVPLGTAPDATFRRAVSDRIEYLRQGAILDEVARYRLYMASAALSPKLLSTRLVLGAVVKSNALLSNVGALPVEILEDSPIGLRDYFSFSQLFPPGRLMLFLSSTPQTLRAVCLWNDAGLHENDVRKEFIPRFVDALDRSVSSVQESDRELPNQTLSR